MFDYPYTNFHEMNLDWIIRVIKNLEQSMKDFVVANRLVFADPLEWDISKNYAMNTFVIDELGNGYLSIRPVPSGVTLNNSSYWMKVFNFGEIITMCNENITANYEKNVEAASKAYAEGEWIMFNDRLYRATMDISLGTPFYPGVNIVRTTVEELVKNFIGASIGSLSDLETEDKTSVVAAINEVLDAAKTNKASIDVLKTHENGYVFVDDYLETYDATESLKKAIEDCPSKGTVVIPRSKQLNITETIVIDKPLMITGISHGMLQFEGGNDHTPNSDYATEDIIFTAGSIGFDLLSPSIYIKDLVISVDVANDFKLFHLSSQSGDTLNLPRDIIIDHVKAWNQDLDNYTYNTYGVYCEQPCLLSTFSDMVLGWFTNGFVFSNTNINTSLNFIRNDVTAKETGYFISKGQYCNFIACGVESPFENYGFYFDQCMSVTMTGCFTEQGLSASVYNNMSTLVVNGLFTTTLPIYKGILGSTTLCGLKTTAISDVDHPDLDLFGDNVSLNGCDINYVKQVNYTYRQGRSNKIINNTGTATELGFTYTNLTEVTSIASQLDKHVHVGGKFTAIDTTAKMICPVNLQPLIGKYVSGDGWHGIIGTDRFIHLTFESAGDYYIEFDYEAIASF